MLFSPSYTWASYHKQGEGKVNEKQREISVTPKWEVTSAWHEPQVSRYRFQSSSGSWEVPPGSWWSPGTLWHWASQTSLGSLLRFYCLCCGTPSKYLNSEIQLPHLWTWEEELILLTTIQQWKGIPADDEITTCRQSTWRRAGTEQASNKLSRSWLQYLPYLPGTSRFLPGAERSTSGIRDQHHHGLPRLQWERNRKVLRPSDCAGEI